MRQICSRCITKEVPEMQR
nr:unnamed protein product [Callosobruchus analis]